MTLWDNRFPRQKLRHRKASFIWHGERIPNELKEVPLDASFSDYFVPFRPKHLPLHPLLVHASPPPKTGNIALLSRTFVRFRSMLTFLRWEVVSRFSNPESKDNPLPALRDILFRVFTAAPHIWRYACADYCKFRKIFQVLISVNVMNTVFWDVPPWSLVDIYRSFGRTCYLNFQGTRCELSTVWMSGCT